MCGSENLYQQQIISEHFFSIPYEMKLWQAKPGSFSSRRPKEKKENQKKRKEIKRNVRELLVVLGL